jgi:hypothetical protein
MSPIGLWLIDYMCFARSILKYVSSAFYSMCYIVGLVCRPFEVLELVGFEC